MNFHFPIEDCQCEEAQADVTIYEHSSNCPVFMVAGHVLEPGEHAHPKPIASLFTLTRRDHREA